MSLPKVSRLLRGLEFFRGVGVRGIEIGRPDSWNIQKMLGILRDTFFSSLFRARRPLNEMSNRKPLNGTIETLSTG